MDAKTVKQTFDLLTYVSARSQLKKAGHYYIGPCPICGGTDRFTLKPTQTGWIWHCRYCVGSGDRYRDAIEMVMRLENIRFPEAVKFMGGDVITTRRPVPPAQPARKPIELPPAEWQAEVNTIAVDYSDRLFTSEGKAAQDYLTSRGLAMGTWYAFLLGYTVDGGRPAITIPWADMVGKRPVYHALKYRYIDDGKQRYGSLKGSRPILFGLDQLRESDDTLILVEGEFNAMSIAQCQPSFVAALSFGSEGLHHVDFLRFLAKKYKRVDIWMDDKARAEKAAKELQQPGGPPIGTIHSPVFGGLKYDANELLKAGLLGELLTKRYGVECLGYTPPRQVV